MMRFLSLVLLGFAVSLLAGCGNKNSDDQLHGNSTRRGAAEQPKTAQKYASFGEPMKLAETDAVPVGTVLANPAKYEGQYVRLIGNVNKVCTSKGCWLEMADTRTSEVLFVKFTCPVDGRLIPMEAVGKPVVVEGNVKVTEISEADARHLREESGAGAEDVEKIKGPQRQITLASPSARIAGM